MPDPIEPATAAPIRVLIAEDETLLRTAMVQLLPQVAGAAVRVVSSCATRAQLLRDTRRVKPDVILLDLRMPDREDQPCTLGGTEIIAALQRQHPGVRVICLSAHAEPERVRACLEAGAAGYLSKGILPEELWAAIRGVVAGTPAIDPLVRAQLELQATGTAVRQQLLAGRRGDVLRLLLEGYSATQIAAILPVGKKHVDKKIAELKQLLGVDTPIQLYRLCRSLGLVDPE
ncbi:response regulator transcription factor [Allochromatium vinosum]|uniref:response regulator transcription factor n=1 Tax=Allochromatium vinosum TaxID=1049 RepID=UPI001905DAB5|nr:response regulator transcription factor [Allochromatium vinosum]MBK1655858.1 response regulator [Allochromatium vinosum]